MCQINTGELAFRWGFWFLNNFEQGLNFYLSILDPMKSQMGYLDVVGKYDLHNILVLIEIYLKFQGKFIKVRFFKIQDSF